MPTDACDNSSKALFTEPSWHPTFKKDIPVAYSEINTKGLH